MKSRIEPSQREPLSRNEERKQGKTGGGSGYGMPKIHHQQVSQKQSRPGEKDFSIKLSTTIPKFQTIKQNIQSTLPKMCHVAQCSSATLVAVSPQQYEIRIKGTEVAYERLRSSVGMIVWEENGLDLNAEGQAIPPA
eukprot:PhF_6_TR30196/c0_g3_i1/m.44379